MTGTAPDPLIFLVAGEPSGDLLGARLMAGLKEATGGRVRFAGVGGERMQGEGLQTLFPMAELALFGLAKLLPKLPLLLRRKSGDDLFELRSPEAFCKEQRRVEAVC